eukprot:CAMPEP_0179725468 /NCGR_PEP_ID=MMETSP0938-20121108/6557_1 /TAXON_ID=548131 ORGANISM="Ostreococcus mediterraneus, Strain clade-D-RCC1107" /NCGR_SAMPLE_ID=MMETSP0938 /ASSEMBLY_ACC=CAM_ASM_000576 /LENGTH=266 /DNA_ID=CAMNT_0021599537 /DNA_START=733 /DNA_END=1535 /DNA_ORIENTATION=+
MISIEAVSSSSSACKRVSMSYNRVDGVSNVSSYSAVSVSFKNYGVGADITPPVALTVIAPPSAFSTSTTLVRISFTSGHVAARVSRTHNAATNTAKVTAKRLRRVPGSRNHRAVVVRARIRLCNCTPENVSLLAVAFVSFALAQAHAGVCVAPGARDALIAARDARHAPNVPAVMFTLVVLVGVVGDEGARAAHQRRVGYELSVVVIFVYAVSAVEIQVATHQVQRMGMATPLVYVLITSTYFVSAFNDTNIDGLFAYDMPSNQGT